jgi:hypothetical protein
MNAGVTAPMFELILGKQGTLETKTMSLDSRLTARSPRTGRWDGSQTKQLLKMISYSGEWTVDIEPVLGGSQGKVTATFQVWVVEGKCSKCIGIINHFIRAGGV